MCFVDAQVIYYCVTSYPKSYWHKATIYYAQGACGGEFSQGTAGMVCRCRMISGASDGDSRTRVIDNGGLESSKGSVCHSHAWCLMLAFV